MVKNDLIKIVGFETHNTDKQTKEIINATFDVISREVAQGNRVIISGFGTFLLREHPERPGRNPKTGETITLPKHKAAHFVVGKTLKRKVQA